MHIIDWKNVTDVEIKTFPYKGKKHGVIGTSVRWLSKYGDDGTGYPEYGLRLFTIQPGGYIPIHNHFYHQSMFILEGEFECWEFDSETDEIKEVGNAPAGTTVYIPSMIPHGMKNISDQPSTFLCCICNVYDDEEKD